MLKTLCVLGLLAGTSLALAAQDSTVVLYVRHGGPGSAGDALQSALDKPYVVMHEPWNTPIREGRHYTTSVVVLNSDATVQGTVDGDVIVINGSLNLTPTARIGGRAIAFGGNVYNAEGAVVTGTRAAYPAARFDTVRTERGLALDYHGPPATKRDPIRLPGVYGVQLPLYDRVDGLSIGWFPELVLGDSEFVAAPNVIYRSNLGAWDAALTVSGRLGGAFASVAGARATLSNDDWIQTDFANSFAVLCCGKDFRNYWRAEYGEARVGYSWADTARTITFWAGARTEKSTSVAAGGPWSITGDASTFSMYRPNPAIAPGRIDSWLAGLSATLQGSFTLQADVKAEFPISAPNDAKFTQLTADVTGKLPTARSQELSFRFHWIYTTGDSTPPQRYGYLGGSGSVLTLPLMGQGGDQLLFAEADYTYTFDGITIPYTTPPSIAFAYTAGAAGVGRLPTITQNIGGRFEIKPFRVDFFWDPKTGQTKTLLLLWFIR
jgi:hypothetical protein